MQCMRCCEKEIKRERERRERNFCCLQFISLCIFAALGKKEREKDERKAIFALFSGAKKQECERVSIELAKGLSK